MSTNPKETSNATFKRGLVSLPFSDLLIWETTDEQEKHEFCLSHPSITKQKVSAVSGVASTTQSDLSYNEPNAVTLLSQTQTLTILFKNYAIAKQWLTKLTECTSKRASYNEASECALGNIFDITYLQSGGTWRDFKVTFVKNTWSCEEFLLFDTTQEDLTASTNEVYQTIESRLDLVNQRMLLGFLYQTEILEKSNRMAKKYLKPYMPAYSYTQSANSRLLKSYKDVDIGQAEFALSKQIAEFSVKKSDLLNEAFDLIELQKSSQVLQIAIASQTKHEVPVYEKIRKKLHRKSIDSSAKERMELDAAAAHISEIIKQRQQKAEEDGGRRKPVKAPERSCGSRVFGDACDCHIF